MSYIEPLQWYGVESKQQRLTLVEQIGEVQWRVTFTKQFFFVKITLPNLDGSTTRCLHPSLALALCCPNAQWLTHSLVAMPVVNFLMADHPNFLVTNPLRQYRISYATAVALTVAVPAAYFLPNVVPDLILLVAMPPHAAIGLAHVIHDYLPFLPAELIAYTLGVILFLALLRLMWEGNGLTKVLAELWRE